MINPKMMYHIAGFLLLVETALLLCCAGVSLIYGEDDLGSFLLSAGLTTLVGTLLFAVGKGVKKQLNRRDGYIIVSVAWVVFSLLGMLPFYLSHYIPSITNALFETMSGFSSTGVTILDDIEALPHGLLFQRSTVQWIGRLGIVSFIIVILPIFGVGGVQLFVAESSGPTYDKVHPHIGVTTKWIWTVYAGLTAIEVTLLLFGGMGLFDNVCHSFATTGTGGYSIKQDGIAYYSSSYIEYVIGTLIFPSGINFTLLLLLFTGRLKKVSQNAGLKWYVMPAIIFTGFIVAVLYHTTPMGVEESFRKAFFQVASFHILTGFVTADYMQWVPVLRGTLTVTMLIGACAGSTAGGMKCIRMVVLIKVSWNEFKHTVHPSTVLSVRVNKQVISLSTFSTILAFSFLYAVIIIISVLLMMAMGVGFTESIDTMISSIDNMGPGLGSCSPAYSWNGLPELAKWLLSFLMLLGRLGLFTVLLLFSSDFWKRNQE